MEHFRIDDSEKERILNLHESATKRQYLSEQDTDCKPINQVDRIETVVKDISKLNWLIDINGVKREKVCEGGFGTKYTFTSEKNPDMSVASFTLDGKLNIDGIGA